MTGRWDIKVGEVMSGWFSHAWLILRTGLKLTTRVLLDREGSQQPLLRAEDMSFGHAFLATMYWCIIGLPFVTFDNLSWPEDLESVQI